MEANIISRIREDLALSVDEKTKASSSRFFKEEVRCYGVKSALVGKIAKNYFNEIESENKKKIFSLCEELFRSDYCEEAFIAAEWAYQVRETITLRTISSPLNAGLKTTSTTGQSVIPSAIMQLALL